MAKPRLTRFIDSEGVVHFEGASLCVNPGLCGNNDWLRTVLKPVSCRGCRAVVEHVYAHAKPVTP